ncbi:MAG: hypothetical protein ACJZ64_08375 [Opitutales bacterium]
MKIPFIPFLTASIMLVGSLDAAKVVFLYGARSHASGDHEFQAGSHLLAKHINAQDKVDLQATVHPGWPEDESILDDADAIVIYADGTKVIGNGWEKMDQLVKEKKTGVLFMHYAVHPSAEQGEKYYLPWIGGFFENGISVNPFWRANIKPKKGHETARGVGPIAAVDEFYFNIKLHPDSLNLGAATPTEENLLRINNIWTRAAYLAKGKTQSLLWESPGREADAEPVSPAATTIETGLLMATVNLSLTPLPGLPGRKYPIPAYPPIRSLRMNSMKNLMIMATRPTGSNSPPSRILLLPRPMDDSRGTCRIPPEAQKEEKINP